MKFFLDSSDVAEIQYARRHWAIDGVTTNPRLIMLSGKPFHRAIGEIADAVRDDPAFPVSVEINPHLTRMEDMIAEARALAAVSANFVIKLPCTEQGNCAARHLIADGVRVNITLVFSAAQSIQAGRLGAAFVAPFVAWKEEACEDAFSAIREIVQIYRTYGFKTEIIVAAIRNARQIARAALAGGDIVTAGFEVYRSIFDHPFTDRGLNTFRDCWDKTAAKE